jgi:ribosomal protein L11
VNVCLQFCGLLWYSGPAIGQALGPLGLNMAEFCKQFNEATKNMDKDTPIPVLLSGVLLLWMTASSAGYLLILLVL